MADGDELARGPGTNTGHGHVWTRPDGMRMRCGGPPICAQCARDAAAVADERSRRPIRTVAEHIRQAADRIESRYPTSVWPADSQHPEARVAAGVRLACRQMRHEADLIEQGDGDD